MRRDTATSDKGTAGRSRGWAAWVALPLLWLALLAAPSVTWQLPAYRDMHPEQYQPFRALNFFKSKGQAYHKWGVLPNFVLAPGYAASLGYWYVTGDFDEPQDDYPYGLKRPLEQLTWLIFQGRALMLAINVLLLGWFAWQVYRFVPNRLAGVVAVTACVATNTALALAIPLPRPDGLAAALTAAALGVYLRILHLGLTVRRTVAIALLIVLAVSTKELAAFVFVLPALGVLIAEWRSRQGDGPATRELRRCIGWGLVTAAGSYALLNVVYAPHVWWRKMRFWLVGVGLDPEAWAGRTTEGLSYVIDYAQMIFTATIHNLGPGGLVVTGLALLTLLWWRPPRAMMYLLPPISLFMLGLLPIGYAPERFYLPLAVAVTPAVALGLAELFGRVPRVSLRRAMVTGALVLLGVNVWWSTYAWLVLPRRAEPLQERLVLGHVPRGDVVFEFTLYKWQNPMTRFSWLGYEVDPRPVAALIEEPETRPEWLYTDNAETQFIDHAKDRPARARMIERSTGVNAETWTGIEGLGYEHVATLRPELPRWFPFGWVPRVEWSLWANTAHLYRRTDDPPRPAVVDPDSAPGPRAD